MTFSYIEDTMLPSTWRHWGKPVVVMYCTKSEFTTFITQSSIAYFNRKLKWPKDVHHCFIVLILWATLPTASFSGEGELNVMGEWATILFQILKVNRIKSSHQVKLSCISSHPLSKLQVVSTIRWWLLLPNSFHFTFHRSYYLKLCQLFYWQHQ